LVALFQAFGKGESSSGFPTVAQGGLLRSFPITGPQFPFHFPFLLPATLAPLDKKMIFFNRSECGKVLVPLPTVRFFSLYRVTRDVLPVPPFTFSARPSPLIGTRPNHSLLLCHAVRAPVGLYYDSFRGLPFSWTPLPRPLTAPVAWYVLSFGTPTPPPDSFPRMWSSPLPPIGQLFWMFPSPGITPPPSPCRAFTPL